MHGPRTSRRDAVLVAAIGMSLAPQVMAEVPALRGVAIGAGDGPLVVTLPVATEVTAFTLDDPPRVVIDVVARSALPGTPLTHHSRVDRWGVTSLRSSQYDPGPERPITRIVLDMDARVFPPPGEGPIVRVSLHESFTRVLVRGRLERSATPLVIGRVSPGIVSSAFGIPQDTSPDTPSRGLELPAAADSAIAVLERAREAIQYNPAYGPPDVSVDPTEDMIAARRARLWDNRAAELVAKARLRLAAGDHKGGIASAVKVLRYYPESVHAPEAHAVAAALYADLRFDHEALSHVEAVLGDPDAPDSLLVSAVRTATACPSRPIVWRLLHRIHRRAGERLGDTERVRALGGRLGLLMARRGESIDESIRLIRAAVEDEPDAPWAADLHEGFAICHLEKGDPARAARQHLFAAELVRQSDPGRSVGLRLRAADAYFEADDLPRALAAYRSVLEHEGLQPELRAWARFQLGNCHFRTRAFTSAADAYRSLAAEDPRSFWAQQAATRLAVLSRAGVVP